MGSTLESINFADKASVLATMIKGVFKISAYNLLAINLLTFSLVETITFPPICPHFLFPGL